MTFVELVESLRQECGVSGPVLSTVQTLSGELGSLKRWTAQAWTEIQARHMDWQFLRTSSTHIIPQFGAIIQPAEYLAGEVAEWKRDSFRVATSGDGRRLSQSVPYVPYDSFVSGIGVDVTNYARPMCFAIRDSDKAVLVAPAADTTYELYYDYWRTPVTLSADSDTPACPVRFHMIIVYRAMMKYGRYNSAPEIYADGKREFNQLLRGLEIDQLPPTTFAGGWGS